MKRILVVVDNLNQGGIASIVLRIQNSINAKMFSMDYITYVEPDIIIKQVLEKRGSNIYLISRLSKTTPFKYVNSIKKIIREKGPYDIIHVHTSSFIWLACLAAKKEKITIRIGHAHGSKNSLQFPFSNILYSLFKGLNQKYCTRMLACADASGRFTFGKNYEFMPNFIDHNDYKSIDRDEKYNFLRKYKILDSATKYCFIGYLGGEKNPIFALQLFKRILERDKNSYLFIAGDGPDMEMIEKYIKLNKMSKSVVVFGNTSEIRQILQISDILIMPSFSEGMSMAILEAQISGVNCIVSNGVPNTNDIQAGLFHKCKTYDFKEWNNMIDNILLNKNKIDIEEIVACLKSIGYDKDSVMSKLESIYLATN